MNITQSSPPTGSAGPEVRTTAGAVRGRWEDGLAVFRGIPFAEPPVGEARFAAAAGARLGRGAEGVVLRLAAPAGPHGCQGAARAADLPKGDDWLTVNVWTPDPGPVARRPVMVWIYGGGYELGFSGGYDAGKIARAGGVVVVSFNYREGIEGYARIEGAPANRGLLDQVAALHWVQDNIAAFGGDPHPGHRLRPVGRSRGGRHAAGTPSAVGLFSRGIIESLPVPSDELAADIAATMAAEVGRRPTAADLSVVDPRQLPAAGADLTARISQYADRWGPLAQANRIFAPVVDGEVLPATPWQALADGAAREVELIVGHNREEYRFFMVLGGQVEKISDEQATRALRALAPGPDGEHAYRQAYPGVSAEQLFQLVQSDWQYRMPTLHLADAQAAGGGRVHLYELTWPAQGSGGAYRACHTLEVTLLFGNPNPAFLGPEPPPDAWRWGTVSEPPGPPSPPPATPAGPPTTPTSA